MDNSAALLLNDIVAEERFYLSKCVGGCLRPTLFRYTQHGLNCGKLFSALTFSLVAGFGGCLLLLLGNFRRLFLCVGHFLLCVRSTVLFLIGLSDLFLSLTLLFHEEIL